MPTSSDYDKLLEKRDALRARLESIKQDYKAGLSADFSEQAVELENRDVLNEIARTTEEELERIEKLIAAHKDNA